jgi:flagellar biosynthesis protein FliR
MNLPLSALEHVVPFCLVFARLAGLFLIAPMLTSTMIPVRFKALLVFMLAAAVYPLVPVSPSPGSVDAELVTLIPILVKETLIGFSIGFLAAIPLAALEMSGVIMSQMMGMGMGRVYNPEMDVDADLLGQLMFYIASLAFIGSGGLEALMRSTLHSFETVPLGGLRTSQVPLELVTGVLESSFDLALRVSAPVMGIVVMLVLLMGILSKTMPQLNVMTVGFTIKMLVGIGILITSVYAIQGAAIEELDHVVRVIAGSTEGLAR